jgi:hypothetical protein
MKTIHLAAVICFVIALVSYSLGGKVDFVAGFTVLGFFFETVGWKNFLDHSKH